MSDSDNEIAALRRPVEQSEAAELIRAKLEGEYEGSSSDAETLVNELFGDIRALLCALDTTARQLRERVEMLEAAQGEIQRLSKSHEQVCNLHQSISHETFQEIARLSSPPPERKDLAERQSERKLDKYLRSYPTTTMWLETLADIDTLLADLTALRNAHQDRVQMLSVVQDSLTERNRECVELRERCGRLETALQFYADLENHQGNAATGHVPIVDDDNLGDRARAALAASQQHTAGSGDGVAGD